MAYHGSVCRRCFLTLKGRRTASVGAWTLLAVFTALAQTYSGIDYGGTNDPSQKLDIYMPTTGAKPYPVAVWIHGGRFSEGSRTEANAGELGRHYRAPRSRCRQHRLPFVGGGAMARADTGLQSGHSVDTRESSKYNFDPNRIAAAGGSAGGHLSEFVGVTGDITTATSGAVTMDLEGAVGGTTAYSSSVQAVVPMYGLSDFLTLMDTCPQNNPKVSTLDHNAADSPESALIGGPIQSNKDKCALAAPLHFVSQNAPPFCILHGDMDQLVPVCQSITFAAALRAAFSSNKKECQFIQYPTLGHGFDVTTCKDTIRAFLTRSLINIKTAASDRLIEPARKSSASRVGKYAFSIGQKSS